MDELKACLHCGSDAGYVHKRNDQYTVIETLDGESEAEWLRTISETKPRCINCGKVNTCTGDSDE